MKRPRPLPTVRNHFLMSHDCDLKHSKCAVLHIMLFGFFANIYLKFITFFLVFLIYEKCSISPLGNLNDCQRVDYPLIVMPMLRMAF